MMRKYSFFAVWAILATLLSCNAEELSDAEQFIKESLEVLDTLEVECREISDYLITYSDPDHADKANIEKNLTDCGKELLEISTKAATFKLSKIEDVQSRETIKRLRNTEKFYKFGEDLLKIGDNWKRIQEAYVEADIESYNDGDIKYSVKKIEDKGFYNKIKDINEINYYWNKIADKAEVVTWKHFFKFIDIVQKKAETFNISAVKFWYPNYNEETMANLETIMKALKPFYEQLQAYIRSKLLKRYSAGIVKPKGPIPESLLHQIEDSIWSNNSNYEEDFPLTNFNYLNSAFEENKIKDDKLLELADSYYKSLGFKSLSLEYLKEHLKLVENDDCIEGFGDRHNKEVFLNYCNESNLKQFFVLHDYVGRIYAAELEKDDHWLYYDDNAWGEVIGGAVLLAARNRNYLEQIEVALKGNVTDEWMNTVNFKAAMDDMFYLARKYVSLRLITDFLANKVDSHVFNKHYWELFEEYAGVEAPIDRTVKSVDLPFWLIRDIYDNRNFLRDFEIKIHIFEVYKAACQMAVHKGELNECAFNGVEKVGDAFKQILADGSKKPFDSTIKPLIASYNKPSAEALLSYYEPTYEWLKCYNEKHNLNTGWTHSKKIA